MKSLNLKSLFLALTVALFVFSSCKKDKDATPAPPTIEGTWVGKYGAGNNPPSNYFSFIISNDGTMKVKSDDPNKEYNGTGTWTISGETFTAVYQYAGQIWKWNVAAKVNIAAGTMDGSYGDGETTADNGTYTMTRQ